MSIRFYDEAIVKKITSWVKDSNMTILKPDEVTRFYQIVADNNNDKPLTLPLISIARTTEVRVLQTGKTPMSSDGMKLQATTVAGQHLNAIPIEIGYQIDIYTKYYDEGDEYLRNFIFNIVNHPKLSITIPYNDANYVHNAYLMLDSTVEDNSDIEQRMFAGQFTRWTIRVLVNDAYLFSAPYKNTVLITETDVMSDSNVEVSLTDLNKTIIESDN